MIILGFSEYGVHGLISIERTEETSISSISKIIRVMKAKQPVIREIFVADESDSLNSDLEMAKILNSFSGWKMIRDELRHSGIQVQ